jgi:hypothetical protein
MMLDTQSLLYIKKMAIGRAGFALKPAKDPFSKATLAIRSPSARQVSTLILSA